MTDHRAGLEAWLAERGLGDEVALAGSDYTDGIERKPINGATRRGMFIDAVYVALEGDPLLQSDQEARQALQASRKRLQQADKALRAADDALAAVLADPHAVLGMYMTKNFEQLKLLQQAISHGSVKEVEATVTPPPGRPQVPVDPSIGYMAQAWQLCFGKKPSPEKRSQFYDFIAELTSLGLMRAIDHTVLRRIL